MSDIFMRMLEITAVSSAIILAVFVFRALLAKRIRPGAVGMLWALVLLRLCLPLTLESPVHLPQLIPQQQEAAAEQPAYNEEPDPVYIPADFGPGSEYEPETVYEITPQASAAYEPGPAEGPAENSFSADWLAIAAYIWLAGAAAVLLSAVWKGAAFGHRAGRCEAHEEACRIADGIRVTLRVRRVPVKVCGDIKAPVLFGLLRPQILLPRSCRGADGETLRCILTHELCHVKRHDILKSYIWLIAKAAHWFNPLVWLAYASCKDDTELCCDDMVLRLIGANNRFMYTQSLIDVFRSYRRALPAAVPLFEKKPKLTERVMRMLEPSRRSKAAAVLSILLALMMLVAGFTTACSPAAEMVNTEGTEQPTATQQPAAEQPEPTTAPTTEPYTVTQWTDKVEEGRLTIDINAEIVTPNVSKFPLYNIKGATLSQDIVDKLKEIFFGDATVYEYTLRMKEEEDLEDSNKIYAAMQDGTYEFSEYDDKEELISGMRTHINSLKKSLKKLPDTGLMPLDMTLSNHEYEMDGITEAGDKIDVWKGMPRIYLFRYDPNLERDVNNEYIKQPEPAAMTREEAIAQAEELLKELGLTDFRFYKDRSAHMRGNEYLVDDLISGNVTSRHPHVYGLVFTRVVDGIQLASSYSRPDSKDSETLNRFFQNFEEEKITIAIDDDGIRGFDWMAGIDTELVDGNPQLKNIEDIKQTVIEQLLEKYEDVGENYNTDTKNDDEYYKLEHYTLHVKSMRLEYACAPVGDDYDTPYLVPVWNIYATNESSAWRKVNGEEVLRDSEHHIIGIELTINAIDGSVIGTVKEIN
jgi:beta-lactamase regulating signal transducer with metallopeptidase domain